MREEDDGHNFDKKEAKITTSSLQAVTAHAAGQFCRGLACF